MRLSTCCLAALLLGIGTASATIINVPADHPTIQAAVTAATAGDTIIVAAGAYVENVSITKSLILQGAQAGVDARGRVASETVVSPTLPGTATFTIAFSGTITIDGFSFVGGTSATQGCIYTSVGPNNDMQIVNNRFSGYSTAAIWLNRGGSDITIDKNVLDGSGLDSGGTNQAIFLNGPQSYAGLFLTNNWIINNTHRYGLFVDGNHNVGESTTRAPLISGNLFDNNLQGMNLGSRSFGTLAAPVLGAYGGTISDNTFSNHAANGVQGGIQHVLVTGNTFSGNTLSGLVLTSFGNTGADRGGQNSLITQNSFAGNVVEDLFFSASQGVGLISTNKATNNSFGSTKAVTYNETVVVEQETIDCSANWWGNSSGPTLATHPSGTGGLISGAASHKIDFTPWLNVGTDTSVAAGFQGSFSTLSVDDDSPQVGTEGRIQEGVDKAVAGATIDVHPGSYDETATNRFVLAPSAQGPHQFGVFVDKSGLTIQGVDAGGSPITSYAGVVADVTTNATNNFGSSGWFVEGDGVTVSGLEISYNLPATNKTMEIIGDAFTLVDCVVADFDQTFLYGGSIYFNDWRVDDNLTPGDFTDDVSHIQSYNVQDNHVIYGNSIDFTSGAGVTGPVASRTITGNEFDVTRYPLDPNTDLIPWPVISFNGSGSCVAWFVYGVGGATISGNTFGGDDPSQFIRARADYDNTEFDWSAYWTANTYSKGTVALITEIPFDVETSTAATFCGSFSNVRSIGATIQREVDRALAGDTVLAKPGEYEEQVLIDSTKDDLTLKGSGSGSNPATSTIVQSPAALPLSYTTSAVNRPVVFVDGADDVSIQDLRVDGLRRGNANNRFQGIAYWNADGTIDNAFVTGIANDPPDGVQAGLGIIATNSGGGPYVMNVLDSTVEDYQKGGFVMSGTGLTANLQNCSAFGYGPVPFIAQNGIQVSYGASATIDGCTVEGHSYIPSSYVSAGMILYDADAVNVLDSTATNNDVSVYAQDTNLIVDALDVVHSDDGLWDAIDLVNTAALLAADGTLRRVASPVEELDLDQIGDRSADMTASITNSTLTGNDDPNDPNSAGIFAYSNAGLLQVTATHNNIADWIYGVSVVEAGAGTVETTANFNRIYSNLLFGFSSFGATVQNAENNWWGDCTGPLDSSGTDEAGNPPCFPAATMSNTDGLGNGVTDLNVDYCPWLCNPATISLLPQGGDTCLEPGDTLVVEIKLSDVAPIIVGGQFYLNYDNTLLTYAASATPPNLLTGGNPGDSPFVTEIVDFNIGANKLFYSVGTSIFGGSGTAADTVMARLYFTVNGAASACSLAATVGFEPDAGALQNKLSDELGDPVVFTQNPLPAITIDDAAPTVSAISVVGGNVDASCERLVTYSATIDDNCCLLAADVSAGVSLTTGNAILGATTPLISQVDADTVSISGSVLVSALTSCPATVQLTVNAVDCCGHVMTAVSATGDVNDVTAPVVLAGPDFGPLPADAGGCTRFVDWADATATDNCDPTLPILYDIDLDDNGSIDTPDHSTSDFTFPVGTHRVTAKTADACGNPGSDFFLVTITGDNELVVTVELEWAFTGSRCITFELFDCTGPSSSVVSSVMSFSGGTATDTIDVPCGAYTCITARDRLHTLRQTVDPLTDLGTQFSASFTGADKLRGGNLNDDFYIDILDFGVYSWQYGTNYGSVDTTCATPYPHADISGNIGTPGLVFTEDFTFIQINFLDSHEANCCGLLNVMGGDPSNPPFETLPNAAGPIMAVSIAELRDAGLGHLAAGDLNGDGTLDVWDMLAFMTGARPQPISPIPSDAVETIDGARKLESAPIRRWTPRERP